MTHTRHDAAPDLFSHTWASGPLLGFDTETTGVSTSSDRIVTAALVRRDPLRGTTVDTWLIDPGIPIPEAASAIHGITTEHARLHGVSPWVALDEIAARIAADMSAGVPLVAFNATFDVSILEAELVRHGLPTLADRLGGPVIGVIDPLVIDRKVDRWRKGKRKLVDLCGIYGVDEAVDLHTADVDVIATLDVLAAMIERYPALAQMDLRDLHGFQAEAHREWAASFNAWRVSKSLDGPGAGLEWLVDER
ncbi:exonuclease domain-containing protein [Sanguibacter sp. A247]|uniref:exonuclease domain-containing protein n=1 Tax=unclassified Sanguibacter TaxID=2645534 RepID=UPI003FD77425